MLVVKRKSWKKRKPMNTRNHGEKPTGKTPFDPFEDFQSFAGSSSVTVDDVFDARHNRMFEKSFPTPNCLRPSTIASYSQDAQLTQDEQQHVTQCVHCRALLKQLVPDPQHLEEFQQAVRAQRMEHQKESEAAEGGKAGPARFGFAGKYAAFVTATIVVGAVLMFGFHGDHPSGLDAKLAVPDEGTRQHDALPEDGTSGAAPGIRPGNVHPASLTFTDGNVKTEMAVTAEVRATGPHSREVRLAPESQSKAAAMATALTSAKSPDLSSPDDSALFQGWTDGLHKVTVKADALKDPGNAKGTRATVNCESFARAIRGKDKDHNIKVTPEPDSESCVIRSGAEAIYFKPKQSVDTYRENLKVLQQGNVQSWDQWLQESGQLKVALAEPKSKSPM
jgi:hypothetical protein